MEFWLKNAFLLLVDVCQNTLALMMAQRVQHARILPLRVFFAAFLGAVLALAARFMQLSRAAAALLWLPGACLMALAAGGCGGGKRRLFAGALALLACYGFLGGVVLALYGATGSLMLAHGMSGACAAAIFVSAVRTSREGKHTRRMQVECVLNGKTIAFDAIADSGNTLRDYLTSRPVIVVGPGVGERVVKSGAPLRPIFADTAGGRQMMRLAMSERTLLAMEGRKMNVRAAIAVSSGLAKRAPALVPAELIEEDL